MSHQTPQVFSERTKLSEEKKKEKRLHPRCAPTNC